MSCSTLCWPSTRAGSPRRSGSPSASLPRKPRESAFGVLVDDQQSVPEHPVRFALTVRRERVAPLQTQTLKICRRNHRETGPRQQHFRIVAALEEERSRVIPPLSAIRCLEPDRSIMSRRHRRGLRVLHALQQNGAEHEQNTDRHDGELLIASRHKRDLTEDQRSDHR